MSKVVHEVPTAHLIAAVLQTETILNALQRELYRALPGISYEQLREHLSSEILRTDVISGPQAEEAQALLDRLMKLRKAGLTTTQALNAITGQTTAEAKFVNDDEDVFRILREDKREAGGGG